MQKFFLSVSNSIHMISVFNIKFREVRRVHWVPLQFLSPNITPRVTSLHRSSIRRQFSCSRSVHTNGSDQVYFKNSFLRVLFSTNTILDRQSMVFFFQEAHRYLDEHEHSATTQVLDSDRHRPFYVLMQSIYYVLCFCHTDLLDSENVRAFEFFAIVFFLREFDLSVCFLCIKK